MWPSTLIEALQLAVRKLGPVVIEVDVDNAIVVVAELFKFA